MSASRGSHARSKRKKTKMAIIKNKFGAQSAPTENIPAAKKKEPAGLDELMRNAKSGDDVRKMIANEFAKAFTN